MHDKPAIGKPARGEPVFAERIGAQAARKLKARRHAAPGVWFGLGMMGLIGWSVSVPTLLGAALGLWLDHHHAGKHAWTLALLMAGLTIGCLNAWHWVAREDKAMHEEAEDREDDDHA
ncbi:MAG: F0F1 ATP synthase subunit [Rhodanobacter sp.]|nr:MAG: F0F1 ATP synthase subunit [Rhodanobacter sp.]